MGRGAEMHCWLMHSGSEQRPASDWVLPWDCWAIMSSERIHHGISPGSPNFLWLPVQNSSLSGWSPQPSHLPQRRGPLLQHPPFNCSLFPTLLPFLRLNQTAFPPLQLCPLSTSSHTKTSGPRELPHVASLPS